MPIPVQTLLAVAQRAGVSKMSVSRALSDKPGVSPALRQRIVEIARSLGYRPNPLITSLMVDLRSRRSRNPVRKGTVLAYVQRADTPAEVNIDHFAGATRAAEEQGYTLEPFVLGRVGLGAGELNETLASRGIYGLLIAPLPEGHGRIDLDWPRFCAVAIEYTLVEPALDRVVHDGYASMRRILRECRERGLNRLGLLFTRNGSERTEGLYEAAYWTERHERGQPGAAIPPLSVDSTDDPRIAEWFDRHRPDVVVTSGRLFMPFRNFLRKRGLRIPGDCSLVNVNLLEAAFSGIDQNNALIGATAVRLLIEKINRNAAGVPPFPHTVLTPGTWRDGTTLRKQPSRSVAAVPPKASPESKPRRR